MIVQKEDLGLSLSINFPENPNNTNASNCTNALHQLNLMRQSLTSSLPSTSPFNLFQKPYFPQTLLSSETCRVVEPKPFLKGIDVNRLPSMADAEEEAGVSSLINSTNNEEEIETERASRGMSDEEDWGNSRKKLRLSKDQSAVLEDTFKQHNTLNPVSVRKVRLAEAFGNRQ